MGKQMPLSGCSRGIGRFATDISVALVCNPLFRFLTSQLVRRASYNANRSSSLIVPLRLGSPSSARSRAQAICSRSSSAATSANSA